MPILITPPCRIAPQRSQRAMTGLIDDDALRCTAGDCRGHHPGTERVSAVEMLIEAGAPGDAFDDQSDGAYAQSTLSNSTMAID